MGFHKMSLNALSPDFGRGRISVGGQILLRCVAKPRGLFGRQVTKHFGGHAGVIRQVARALPGFGGERRPLCQVGNILTGGGAQFGQHAFVSDARVGRGQTDAAPQVGLPRG